MPVTFQMNIGVEIELFCILIMEIYNRDMTFSVMADLNRIPLHRCVFHIHAFAPSWYIWCLNKW